MMYKGSAIVLAVAAIANAQLPAVPSCSLQCFTTALTSDGCSSITDFACHCAKPQLVSQIQPCIAKACSPQDQATAASAVEQTCQSAGGPIAISGSGSSSSAPASSVASSSAPASSAASSSASASSSAVPSSSAEASSSRAASSSAAPASSSAPASSAAASSASAPVTTAASSGVTAPTAGITTNATSTVAPFTGEASQVKGAFGGVIIMAVALAFAL